MSAISGIGKVLGNLFKAGKGGLKAAESGFMSKAKGAWNAVKGEAKAGLAGVAATNKRLAAEGFAAVGGKGGIGLKQYTNAMRTEYGKRVGKSALAGGAFNALTGVASDEDAGLISRFAKGAVMGGAARGIFAGKYQGISLRKQFWSSNRALNSMIQNEAKYAKYAKGAGEKAMSKAAFEKEALKNKPEAMRRKREFSYAKEKEAELARARAKQTASSPTSTASASNAVEADEIILPDGKRILNGGNSQNTKALSSGRKALQAASSTSASSE